MKPLSGAIIGLAIVFTGCTEHQSPLERPNSVSVSRDPYDPKRPDVELHHSVDNSQDCRMITRLLAELSGEAKMQCNPAGQLASAWHCTYSEAKDEASCHGGSNMNSLHTPTLD